MPLLLDSDTKHIGETIRPATTQDARLSDHDHNRQSSVYTICTQTTHFTINEDISSYIPNIFFIIIIHDSRKWSSFFAFTSVN